MTANGVDIMSPSVYGDIMSQVDLTSPMPQTQARKHLSLGLTHGTVVFSTHALRELKADGMENNDALNVLRAGQITEPAEFQDVSWRYRVHTPRFCVVVVFERDDDDELVIVVTGWRKGR